MKLSRFLALATTVTSFLLTIPPGPCRAATLPDGLAEETVGSGWDGVAGVVAGPNSDGTKNRVYGWEALGKVWIVQNGARLATPLVDISAEVGPEISLLGFALDPAFQTNGYIYLLYTVDRNVLLGKPGRAPSIGRVTRYTCRRDTDFTSVDPASRKILIGETKSTGIPLLERSHGVGALVFGQDGSLLVSTGDGAGGSETEIDTGNSPNALQAVADGIIPASLNIGAWRSQSLDSMSGKILRIDPETGDGLANNPFFQTGSPRASRSRVWAYGLRNPFRFAIQPGTGGYQVATIQNSIPRFNLVSPAPLVRGPDTLYNICQGPGTLVFGDAGWNTAESVHLAKSGGQNFGWPAYEGFDPAPGYRDVTPPAFVDTSSRRLPVVSWTPTGAHARSGGTTSANVYQMGAAGSPVSGPDFSGRASIGGTFIDSTLWPAASNNRYLHMDWGLDDAGAGGWVRTFTGLDPDGTTSIQPFGSDWYHVSHLSFDKPTNSLYYIIWPSTVKRVFPAPAASGPGLLSGRYESDNFTGPVTNTVMADPNFVQPQIYVPGSSFEINPAFSIRYTGSITPRYSESYRFVVDVNDSAKIWINDQLVLDVGNPNGPSPDHWLQEGSAFSLSTGVPAKIKIDYVNRGANSRFTLFWKSASQAFQPIPESAYRTPAADTAPPTFTVTGPASVNNEVDQYGQQRNFHATVTITPSKPVTGLDLSDLILTNCSSTDTSLSFNAANGTYRLGLNSASGTYSVAVKAGAALDASGNPSLTSNIYQGNVLYAAAMKLDPLTVSPDGSASGDFTVIANVLGSFAPAAADLNVSNGTVTGSSAHPYRDSTDYSFRIHPGTAGPVTIILNSLRYFGGLTITVNYNPSVRPTITLNPRFTSDTVPTPGAFCVEVGSSLPLTGLTASDFTITNGTALSLTPLATPAAGAQRYILSIRPNAAGLVKVSLPADAATNSGGTGNQASAVATATYTLPDPTYGLLQESYAGNNFETLLYSRQVPNIAYFDATNGLLSDGNIPASTDNYSLRSTGSIIPRFSETYTFIMDYDDAVRLYVNDQLILDSWNTSGVQWQKPSATIALTAGKAYNFRLDYRELSGNALQYLFWKSPSQPIALVPPEQFRPTPAGGSTADTTPPVLTLTGSPFAGFPNPNRFEVKITPSEPLLGLTLSDFVLANCFLPAPTTPPSPALTQNVDGTYNLSLTAGFGPLSVTLPAGACTDAAGNATSQAASYQVNRPVLVTLTGYSDNATELVTPPGDFTVVLEIFDDVIGLTPSDFIVTNGSAQSVALWFGTRYSSVFYRATIRPSAPGLVTVRLPDGAFTNSAGTANAGTATGSFTYAPPTTRANGVITAYFKDAALTVPGSITIAPNVNFDWALGSPAAGVPVDQFSARFTGCVVPPVSGAMKFYVRADDGARLWLNGVLQFDKFSAGGGEWSANFTAMAGTPVMVKIEYREGWGGAGVGASWSGPGLAKQIIPSSRWLVNETGLTIPISISPEEDAAASSSQIPAAYLTALAALPDIGKTLAVSAGGGAGGPVALTWTCLESSRSWLAVETSGDLLEWNPVPLADVAASPGSPAGYTTFSLPVTTGKGAHYFRLRAVR